MQKQKQKRSWKKAVLVGLILVALTAQMTACVWLSREYRRWFGRIYVQFFMPEECTLKSHLLIADGPGLASLTLNPGRHVLTFRCDDKDYDVEIEMNNYDVYDSIDPREVESVLVYP
jgi:hypothetical protein